jgi:hypothetical protein
MAWQCATGCQKNVWTSFRVETWKKVQTRKQAAELTKRKEQKFRNISQNNFSFSFKAALCIEELRLAEVDCSQSAKIKSQTSPCLIHFRGRPGAS